MKRLTSILAVIAVYIASGCTREQLDWFVNWYEHDPTAATEFAQQPEIQALVFKPESQYTNNHAMAWERIAWCESGAQWHLRASNRTGTYGGGLMIRDNVWLAYGGREYAATADQASKAQQIDIAEAILADVGWGAWDCA